MVLHQLCHWLALLQKVDDGREPVMLLFVMFFVYSCCGEDMMLIVFVRLSMPRLMMFASVSDVTIGKPVLFHGNSPTRARNVGRFV